MPIRFQADAGLNQIIVLNELIRGKRGISADTAWRLGDWLGTGPEMWMDLQSKWDLWHARKTRKSA